MSVFKIPILIIFAALVTLAVSDSSKPVCKKIHVGSKLATTEGFNDIVDKGVTQNRWQQNSTFSMIVGPYKTLEYFYLADIGVKLTQADIELFYDQSEHVKSEVILKTDKKGWYTIEVNYKCDIYGGALISYMMNVNVPGCGTATIAWKKLCGNPYTEREGLTMEMEFDNFKKIIVKNGKMINANYFDRDVNDAALVVPTFTDSVTLRLWIDLDDIKLNDTNISAHTFGGIAQNVSKKELSECYSGRLYVDSDEFFVKTELIGDFATKGGYINNSTKQEVVMKMHCQGYRGSSTIEVDVPLFHFKDLNLYFVKKCEGVDPKHAGSFFGTLFYWIIIMLVGLLVYGTYHNVQHRGYFSLDAIPFYEATTDALGKIKDKIFVATSNNRGSTDNRHHQHRPVRSYDEQEMTGRRIEDDSSNNFIPDDDEADVKIRLEDRDDGDKKYGTF